MIEEGGEMAARPLMSDTVYAALINLEQNKDFSVFVEYLAKRAIGVALLSTAQTGEACHWLQGRSQELRDLSNNIRNARKNYDAIKRSSK